MAKSNRPNRIDIETTAIEALWKRYCCDGARWAPFDDADARHPASRALEEASTILARFEIESETDAELAAAMREARIVLTSIGVAVDAREEQRRPRLRLVPSPESER